ncbi:hypothetical protein MauCBS54593_005604 [Microsporum audouinii]
MPYIPPSSAPPSPTGTSPAPSLPSGTATASSPARGAAGPARRHGRHNSEPALSFPRPSSSSYLHRHRRSPTMRTPVARLQQVEGQQQPHHDVWTGGMGMVLSPPESRNNSGDEEDAKRQGHQQQQQQQMRMLGGLTDAISSIDQKKQQQEEKKSKTEEGSGILLYSMPEQATQTPDQSDQDEEELAKKPPMLRKKSGELVRPAIRLRQGRPLSMPGTPTFSKAVHFGAQLEEVRHFMQLDRPLAVSAGSSPVEEYDGDTEFPFNTCGGSTCAANAAAAAAKDTWEARVTNFPSMLDDTRLSRPVRLRRIQLCPDTRALLGTIAVANLSYSKYVTARFTLDNWKTVSEVTGEYVAQGRACIDRDERVGFDTFSFSIELADQLRHGMENKTLFLCLKYNVGGREFWDNNDDMNYQIVFSRRPAGAASVAVGGCARDPLFRARMARAKNSKSRSRPLSMVAMGMNMNMNVDMGIKVAAKETQFQITSSQPHEVEVDVDSEKEGWFPESGSPTRKNKIRTNVFGDRYDFSASLTTAASPRTQAFGHQHSHSMPELRTAESQESSTSESDESPTGNEKRLSDFLSDRPNHESQVYKELVDKYCFVSFPIPPSTSFPMHLFTNEGHQFGSTKGKRCSSMPSKDGTELDPEAEGEPARPPATSTPTLHSMHMNRHLPRRLSPPPTISASASPSSTSTSTSDTEGVKTPPPSTSGILPFPFTRERGMPASPAPTAILG